MNWTLSLYDDHTAGHQVVTTPQLALFLIWTVALVAWVFKWPQRGRRSLEKTEVRDVNGDIKQTSSPETQFPEKESNPAENENKHEENTTEKNILTTETSHRKITNTSDDAKEKQVEDGGNGEEKVSRQFTKVKPPPTLHDFLGSLLQFGFIMFFFFLTDYIKVFPKGDRIYTRDTFLFLVFLLFLVGAAFTLKPTADKILNRDQTEEWKGWMQVMFVWYHFFAAAEWYNWIRVYIAAYVWMTGFGNFSFFWVRKDYSLWRSLKMLFRLNFLVLVLCAAVSNQFMLYYICPMHTYWFLSVYAMMGIAPSWNESRWGMKIKLALYAVVNCIIFDIPGVAENVFRPFWPVLGFNDGKNDIMHEWAFRLKLDHWACFIGMLCAYNYPYFETFINKIEGYSSTTASRKRELLIKLVVCVPWVTMMVIWLGTLLPLPKFTYNVYHPYFSFIPVLTFILIRNLFPVLRVYYVNMFAWLGKITLETYLSQLHVYLQSNAKHRIVYIEGYPFLNFAMDTVIYLSISYSLFNLTTELSAYLLPHDSKLLARSFIKVAIVLSLAFGLAFFLNNVVFAAMA